MEGARDAAKTAGATAIIQERGDAGGDGERLLEFGDCGFGEIWSRRWREMPSIRPQGY